MLSPEFTFYININYWNIPLLKNFSVEVWPDSEPSLSSLVLAVITLRCWLDAERSPTVLIAVTATTGVRRERMLLGTAGVTTLGGTRQCAWQLWPALTPGRRGGMVTLVYHSQMMLLGCICVCHFQCDWLLILFNSVKQKIWSKSINRLIWRN